MQLTSAILLAAAIAVFTDQACGSDACCARHGPAGIQVLDPTVSRPDDWDDEDDGVWAPPLVELSSLPLEHRFSWELQTEFASSAPWLLAGLTIAGLARSVVPDTAGIAGLLLLGGGAGGGGIVAQAAAGALLGLLLPLCSCGALPVASAVAGAGGSATAAIAMVFVSSGAGIDSFAYTLGAMGMQVAIARMAVTAMLGFVVALAAASVNTGAGTGGPSMTASKTTKTTTGAATTITTTAVTGDAAATVTTTVAKDFAVTTVTSGQAPRSDCRGHDSALDSACCGETPAVAADGCSDGGCSDLAQARRSDGFVTNLFLGLLEAFEEVAVWVGLGIVVTAAANAMTPNWAQGLSDGVIGRLGLVVGSMPFQMCEHAVVNMAVGLTEHGVSLGTAFAVLVISPATNLGFFALIGHHQGPKAVVVAAVASAAGAVALSFVVDAVGPDLLPSRATGSSESLPGWFVSASAPTLGLLAMVAVGRNLAKKPGSPAAGAKLSHKRKTE